VSTGIDRPRRFIFVHFGGHPAGRGWNPFARIDSIGLDSLPNQSRENVTENYAILLDCFLELSKFLESIRTPEPYPYDPFLGTPLTRCALKPLTRSIFYL